MWRCSWPAPLCLSREPVPLFFVDDGLRANLPYDPTRSVCHCQAAAKAAVRGYWSRRNMRIVGSCSTVRADRLQTARPALDQRNLGHAHGIYCSPRCPGTDKRFVSQLKRVELPRSSPHEFRNYRQNNFRLLQQLPPHISGTAPRIRRADTQRIRPSSILALRRGPKNVNSKVPPIHVLQFHSRSRRY